MTTVEECGHFCRRTNDAGNVNEIISQMWNHNKDSYALMWLNNWSTQLPHIFWILCVPFLLKFCMFRTFHRVVWPLFCIWINFRMCRVKEIFKQLFNIEIVQHLHIINKSNRAKEEEKKYPFQYTWTGSKNCIHRKWNVDRFYSCEKRYSRSAKTMRCFFSHHFSFFFHMGRPASRCKFNLLMLNFHVIDFRSYHLLPLTYHFWSLHGK